MNYANLIQNVENIGRFNNFRNPPAPPGLAEQQPSSSFSGKELRALGTMPMNQDEKNQWLVYDK